MNLNIVIGGIIGFIVVLLRNFNLTDENRKMLTEVVSYLFMLEGILIVFFGK